MNTPSTVSPDEAILQVLEQHVDVKARPDGDRTISHLRQEEIADELNIQLGSVIEAMQRLRQSGRIRAERQAPGKPFRYYLLDE